jgi:hypothetical protein
VLVVFTPAAMEGLWEEIGAAVEAGTLDPTKLELLRRTHDVPRELLE